MELFKIFGTIAIDYQDAIDGIDETVDKAESSQGRINDAFKKIGTAVATYFAVDKIVDFGKSCITAAADAQAMESQFSQVFGDLEGQATSNLSAIADQAGITENRMKGSYTKIAAFAKTTGMETADALGLADRAMVAVADSAAFYDRSLEETTESLQSFLKGNYENDAALGLSCTEVTRNAAANELYGKSFNELSESQKQLTLLKMVEDANALSGAMGQAARESSTWTNQTGNLKQSWIDFTAMIGEKFLPVAIVVVEKLSEFVTWLTENETAVAVIAIAIGTLTAALAAYNIVQTIATAGMTLATIAGTAFGAVMAFITSPITLVILAIGALVAIIVLCVKHWNTIKAKVIEVASAIAAKVEEIKEAIAQKVADIVAAVKEKIQQFINIGKEVVDKIKQGISDAWASLTEWFTGIWDSLFGGRNVNVNVNSNATGAVPVNGSHASGLDYVPFDGYIAELHRGEMVVPAEEASMLRGGMNNTLARQMERMIDLWTQFMPEALTAMRTPMVCDTNGLAIAMAPTMDTELGRLAIKKGRGR